MGVDGYYYLHTNGDLIHKKTRPESDSSFVKRIWPIIITDRECAWIICIEALALGARDSRVKELQEKWGLTDEDARVFAGVVGLSVYPMGKPVRWYAHQQGIESPPADFTFGVGMDALHALADLARRGGGLENRGPVSVLLRQFERGDRG